MSRLCLFCPHYIQIVFYGFRMVWFVHNSFVVLPDCLFLLEILGQHWDRGSWVACEQNSACGISAQLLPENDDVKWLCEIFWLLTSLVLEGGKLCSSWVEASVPLLVIVDVEEREEESIDEEEDNLDVGDEQTSSLLYSFLWKDWFGAHCWTIMEESISCDLEIWGKDPVRRCPLLYSFLHSLSCLFFSCLHVLLIMIGLTYLVKECERHHCGNMKTNIKGLLLFFKEFNFPLCQQTLLTELHVLFLFERSFFNLISSTSLWAGFTILGERNQHLKHEKITNVRKTIKLK